MKEISDYQQDIASIRQVMERSVKFMSLSGLSGVLAGFYALAGSGIAYYLIYYPSSPYGYPVPDADGKPLISQLLLLAGLVLLLSLTTGYLLSVRKAKKLGVNVWNKTSREMVLALFIPLSTGGLFILILLSGGYYELVAPICLVFYGLALIQASHLTLEEIRYLGFLEIALGLIAAWFPGYDLIVWATGFGLLHIIYGTVMYYRHDT